MTIEDPAPATASQIRETAFGSPRDFLGNRFTYLVVSPRARGLSVGVNLNPDKRCNFECLYCEVDRTEPPREKQLDVEVMAAELESLLAFIHAGRLRELPAYEHLPAELLHLRHVALSGDGEPTLAPEFSEAVQAVMHVRARRRVPFFKIVLITNASGLNRPQVQDGLKYFTRHDEIWAKLDAGTQSYMDRLNQPEVTLDAILANILALGRQRPVIIQSLFASINGREPSNDEIAQYLQRLRELKAGGAQIPLVQIYSATRPTAGRECGHLPLRTLAHIARRVREETGLRAEVF